MEIIFSSGLAAVAVMFLDFASGRPELPVFRTPSTDRAAVRNEAANEDSLELDQAA
jgi:hypothetical protein